MTARGYAAPLPPVGPDGIYRIPADTWFHFFAADAVARWAVPDGARVRIQTIEGWCGFVSSPDQIVDDFPEGQTNGCTGPIAVTGARPGDTLAIDIEEITILDDHGITVLMEGWGLLGDELPAPRTRFSRIEDGHVVFADAVRLAARPMMGTIGVSPAIGRIPTLVPGSHAGNIDCTRVTAGAHLYLPVNVPGAMLGLGDAKALSGDGEVAAAGVEVSVEALVRLRVIPDLRLPTPMVHYDGSWITIGTADTLDEASREATRGMVTVLEPLLGLDWTDTYAVTGLVGSLRVAQLANPRVTVMMEVPDRLLPDGWPEQS